MGANSSPTVILKGAILGLGLVVLILGCVSHFNSSWVKETNVGAGIYIKPYQACELPHDGYSCPDISLERYFVAMIFISFILSVCSLIASFTLDMGSSTMKYIDMGYHAIMALLLFIAAIVYFVSAEQIYDLFGKVNKGIGFNFRRPEKLAAASLTLIQTVLYGVTAFFISKN